MDTIRLAFTLLYLVFVLGLCTYLLIRGITHSFIALFACGALLHMIPQLGFFILSQMPGGFGANSQYFPMLAIFGLLGTLCFAGGFFLLTKFLLQSTARGAAPPTP